MDVVVLSHGYVCVVRESSCEAGESELNESQEELNLFPVPAASSSSSVFSGGRGPTKRKRLRKRKVAGMRKKLRMHLESVEEFNPEARDAQSAEQNRIRRLKLQQQMNVAAADVAEREASLYPSHVRPGETVRSSEASGMGEVRGRVSPRDYVRQPSKGSSSPEILQVEMARAPASSVGGACPPGKIVAPEAILIDSGSSDSDSPSEGGVNYAQGPSHSRGVAHPQAVKSMPGRLPGRPSEGRQLLRKYDAVAFRRKDGRILVNIGHAHNEPDVFLAPQLSRIAKGHQVS